MNLQVAMQGGDRITKQRNLFLVLTIGVSLTNSRKAKSTSVNL